MLDRCSRGQGGIWFEEGLRLCIDVHIMNNLPTCLREDQVMTVIEKGTEHVNLHA